MFHYSPSSRPQGHTSYLPRRSYFPASFDIDDAPSPPTYALENLGYPSLSHSLLPPRIDAETRYRRALYELEAAEQEYQTHMALERARQACAVRQRAAAEAARRERDFGFYADIERINRARALEEQAEERLSQRQHALRIQAPFHQAHRGRLTPMRAIYSGAQRDSVPQGHPSQPDNETLALGDLLGLFTGNHPERQRGGLPQRPTTPTPSQPNDPTEPHTQPQPPEHENPEVNLSNILEFFHTIAAQARGAAGGEQSIHEHEQSLPSQPEAAPVDGKGKGKAKAQPAPEPTLFETLFRENMSGTHDQELRDIEYAIKLSLEDRDATDVKKAHAFKASRSSLGACSSKVKVEEPSSSGHAASPTRNATSPSVSSPEPVSPLTSIRAVRTRFSALESAFKFPPNLDSDHSELAVTSNNAPVRAYEHALNGLLERLDAIESDGNEEVRDVRREVVREVERALEEVERKVKEQAPQAPVPEVAKQEASDVESEDRGAFATRSIPPAVVHGAKPTLPNLGPANSHADADIDVAISAEYQSASPVSTASGVVVAERDSAAGAAPTNGAASTVSGPDTEAVPGSEDASDSIATITPASVDPGIPASSSSDKSTSTSAGVPHDDDTILVDKCSEGGSVGSVDDEWTSEFNA